MDLDRIRNRAKGDKVKEYRGKNPHILMMKKKLLTQKNYTLNKTQADYFENYKHFDPVEVNRPVKITEYLGKQLQEQHQLKFLPQKVFISKIIADGDLSFHVVAKLYQQQQWILLWLPKSQLLEDPYYEDIEVNVDFDKYKLMDDKGRTPFEHQKEGVTFLLKHKGCILADDMGLGKTYQAIVAALESGAEKILIICPATLKIGWQREIESFCKECSSIIGKQWVADKFTIINYDILKNYHTVIEKGTELNEWEIVRDIANEKFDLMILDEAHYIKNPNSIRGKILDDLSALARPQRVWLLTGTPIANRPMDYFPLLKLIKAPIAQNWMFFAKRYCAGKQIRKKMKNGKLRTIWLTDGASNLEELAEKTKKIILRRKKDDVLDLPGKMVQTVPVELRNRAKYDRIYDEYVEWARKNKKRISSLHKQLVELTLLRSFVAKETVPYSIEQAENAIEQGNKVIIFCNFDEEVEMFMNHFGKRAVKIVGGMSDRAKQHSVDQFQENDKIQVFIGNIIAAGVGITLTAGSVVIMNSLNFVPGNHDQAEDRAYRIGQKKKVTVYYMLMEDTVIAKVWEILQRKKKVIGTIMGEPMTEESVVEELVLTI